MERHLKVATVVANLLDNQFEIAGLRFGLASLINLIPGFGDFLSAILSLYLVLIGLQMKLPTIRIIQMLYNILLSFLVGLIPVLGDAAYILRKANLKNLKILRNYTKEPFLEGKLLKN